MGASTQDDRGPGFTIFVIFMIIITVAALVLRFVARSLANAPSRGRSRYWWDDWIALVAGVYNLTQLAILLGMVYNAGLGRHYYTLSDAQQNLFSKLAFALSFFTWLSLGVPKVSVLLFLNRVFPRHARMKWWSNCLWATHAINAAWILAGILVTSLACHNVSNTPSMTSCQSGEVAILCLITFNIIIDLMILLLPIPQVWGLQMPKDKKIGVSIVFLMGYFVIALSIGALVTALKVNAHQFIVDPSYVEIPYEYWLIAIGPFTLLSTCLPAMLPLAQRATNRCMGSRNFFSLPPIKSGSPSRKSSPHPYSDIDAPGAGIASSKSTSGSSSEGSHSHQLAKVTPSLAPGNRSSYYGVAITSSPRTLGTFLETERMPWEMGEGTTTRSIEAQRMV